MSSLLNLYEFFNFLKQIPKGSHLGVYIRTRSPDKPLLFRSFDTSTRSFSIYVRLHINGLSNPIEGIMLFFKIDLENKKLIIRLSSDDKERIIPFDDLIGMEEIPKGEFYSNQKTRIQAGGSFTCGPQNAIFGSGNQIQR